VAEKVERDPQGNEQKIRADGFGKVAAQLSNQDVKRSPSRSQKMRRLSLLFFGLCLVPSADAGLFISVNGIIEPPSAEVKLQPDATAVIGIHGDGLTPPRIAAYLLVEGPGSIDRSTMVYRGSLSSYQDFPLTVPDIEAPPPPEEQLRAARELLGRPDLMDLSFITLADGAIPPAPLKGLLVDNIIFRCDGLGDVTLSLVSDDLATLYDTQAIQQVPEPMTLLLLGMGVFLMRRKRSS
jgi:hypothetical protein